MLILKGLRCYAGSIEIGGVHKQKRGCLIAKLAAGFLGAVSNKTDDTQIVIRCQPKNVPGLRRDFPFWGGRLVTASLQDETGLLALRTSWVNSPARETNGWGNIPVQR